MSRSRSSSLTSVPQAEQNLSSNKSETLVKSLLIFCELKELVKKILEAKKNAPKNKTAIEDLISQGQLLFVDLKELNRELLTDVEADKDKLNKHKEQLNQLHLRLQNFQYEKNHLLREIESCKNYRPKQQIDGLVSEEEFLHSATPDQLPQDKGDEHQVMLKRLAFELDQRRKLSDQIAEMTTRKKALIDMNESRANYLKGLQSKLKAIDTASKQLDPHITLSIKQRFKNADQAQFLPGPLYILFSHLNAYKESYDLDVEISVEGNIEDARAEYGKVVEKKKPVNEDEAYTSHPLFVQLSFSKVNARTLNPPVTIKFEYLTYLNIVAVSVTTTNAALSDKDFLIDLFPQDSGENTPNMANLYLFGGKPFSFDPSKKGRPFWWAQWLSGLQFLRNRPEISQNNEAMQVDQVNPLDNNYHFKITEVFDRIKKRVLARLTLSQQLEQLSKLRIALVDPATGTTTTTTSTSQLVKSATTLTSFGEITAEKFYGKKYTARKELTKSTPVNNTNSAVDLNVAELSADPTSVTSDVHASTSTALLDGQYVPLDEVEEEGMLVDDLASTSPVTPVNANSSLSESGTPPKHCTYYRAVFLTDKEQVEVRIELSKEYPLRPPLFRIKKAKKKPVAGAATTTTATAPQLPNYPQHIRNKVDANALQQLSASVKESSYDPTLKQIESELNTNSSALVGSESDRINILPLLMNRLRFSLDVANELDKKGDSVVTKMFGRAHHGKDRHKPLSQAQLNTLL